ncbi:MAG: SAM-dependent methyltransferase [Pseudomonadota bacterium]|nr:SAM-dependent methyltransferase [Pseudomonadota bacterium]
MAGRLYLVPNLLGVIAPDAVLPAHTIAVARQLRHYVVENAKPARQFLKSLAIEVPIATIHIEVLPVKASAEQCSMLLEPARAGEDIGLLSDAGCPGVADPGAALVHAAHRAGVAVVPLVGPSSLLLALMASGLNGQTFTFHGYLPVEAEARARKLRQLDDDAVRTGTTHLFIETPYRNRAMLSATLASCRATTELCVAVDLTLPTEWIASERISAWKTRALPDIDKRPAMFLLGRR